MFGGKGSLDSQLSSPRGLSVDSDGNIIVADAGNKLIKIFSPDGKFLMKIGGQGSLTDPIHCGQYDRYLSVRQRRTLHKGFRLHWKLPVQVWKAGWRGRGVLSSPLFVSEQVRTPDGL